LAALAALLTLCVGLAVAEAHDRSSGHHAHPQMAWGRRHFAHRAVASRGRARAERKWRHAHRRLERRERALGARAARGHHRRGHHRHGPKVGRPGAPPRAPAKPPKAPKPPKPPKPHGAPKPPAAPAAPAAPGVAQCTNHCSAQVSNDRCHDHCFGTGEGFCHDHCYGAFETNCHDHCFGAGDTNCHDSCYGAGDSDCHNQCYGVEDISCQNQCYAAGATNCQADCFGSGQGTGTKTGPASSTGTGTGTGTPTTGPPSTGPPLGGGGGSSGGGGGSTGGGGGGSSGGGGGGGSSGGGGGSSGNGGHSGNGGIVTSVVPSDSGTGAVGQPSAGGAIGLGSGTATGTGAGTSTQPKVTIPLAAGTAGVGRQPQTTGRARTRTRGVGASLFPRVGSHGLQAITGAGPATLIDHFINVIPWWIWLAFGLVAALAAAAGVAAVRSGRRARERAGEVALASAAAITDPLTGILNRRGFTDVAERELQRAQRYGHPLALAFVDVRGLKSVNDTRGHRAGDELLRQVAALLKESSRSHDIVGRIGGDELAVMLTEQGADGMAAVMRRVRSELPAAREALGFDHDWDLTIGMAVFPRDGHSLEDLLATADRRLYLQRGIELR
jgi:diguanylate cyclase (GGDEF)-like protein